MPGTQAPAAPFLPFESDEPGLSAAWRPMAGGGILFVMFSQIRVPAGKFGLARLVTGRRHSGLFLNDHRGGWYLGQDDAIDRLIDRAIAATAPARIVYYGTSMGGYGALVTGLRRRDGDVIAYGADLPLGLDLSQSAAAGLTDARDLFRDFDRPTPHRITLCWGVYDAADAASWSLAARRVRNPAVRLVPVASGHAVHDHLHTVNVVRRIIADPRHDLGQWVARRGLAIDADPLALAEFHRLAAAFAAGHDVRLAEVLALHPAYHPGIERLAAEIEARAGALDAAADRLGRLFERIQREPGLASLPHRWVKPIARRRIEMLLSAGRLAEAGAFRRACAEIYPREPDFMPDFANDATP